MALLRRWPLSRVAALFVAGIGMLLLLRARVRHIRSEPYRSHASTVGPRPDRAMFGFNRSRLLRAFFRAPIGIYRLGLGGVLGHRFLLLTHRGRKSGRIHQTVLEVVHYDPVTQESVVVSGWGTRADWYRNIQASSPLKVETGGKRFRPVVRELAPGEAPSIVSSYAQRMPAVARPLLRWLGFEVGETDEQRRAHAEQLLLIGFRPAPADEPVDRTGEASPPT